jgi:hypothetical protein
MGEGGAKHLRGCVRDARLQGREPGADARALRERTDAGERRGLGAVGNGRIVAYGARSPTRSAAEGHTPRTTQLKPSPYPIVDDEVYRDMDSQSATA